MKKIQKTLMAGALAVGLGVSGAAMTACFEKPTEPSIEVSVEFKNEYLVGETLDVTGGFLTYTGKDGKETPVQITADMCEGFSSTLVGDRQLIISYEGLTVVYEYSVKYPTSLSLATPFNKTIYYVGEDLDVRGAQLLFNDEDGNANTVDVVASMVSGFDSSSIGEGKLAITYQGKTVYCDYEVKQKATLKVYNDFKNEYFIGETLDVTGGVLEYVDEEGNCSYVDITADMVKGFASTDACSRDVIITYEGVTILYAYTVKYEEKIEMFSQFKSKYYIGEELNLTGGILLYTDANGKKTYVPIEEDMISGFTNDTYGERNIVITYEDFTMLYPYTVKYQPTLSIEAEFEKTVYEKGEALDVTGAKLSYKDEDGTIEVVDVAADMVAGFTSTTVGEKQMTITYNDLTVVVDYEITPVFAQIGVPYYFMLSAEEGGTEVPTCSVIIFNEDKTFEAWTSTVVPTINNQDEIFTEDSLVAEKAMGVGAAQLSVVEDKYVLTLETPSPENEIKFIIIDKETIELSQTFQGVTASIQLHVIGEEDENFEYSTIYVGETVVTEGEDTFTGYMLLNMERDGSYKLYSTQILPTEKNIEVLIEALAQTPSEYQGSYTSSMVDGKLTFADASIGTFTLEEDGTIKMVPAGSPEVTLNFTTTLSTADEALEYGAYYVPDATEGLQGGGVICFGGDGKVLMYPLSETPTVDNIDEIIANAESLGQVQTMDYTSYVDDGVFTIKIDKTVLDINEDGSFSFYAGVVIVFRKLA